MRKFRLTKTVIRSRIDFSEDAGSRVFRGNLCRRFPRYRPIITIDARKIAALCLSYERGSGG